METLVHKLQRDHPDFVFKIGAVHCWSPGKNEILYAASESETDIAGLLHELGHARLGHRSFASDIALLQKEVEAWEEARRLAECYGIALSEDHIQDCLDSYRDWLYRRSQCPDCHGTGVQQTGRRYVCLNCGNSWLVSSSRLRRPYRRQAKTAP